MRFDVDAAIVQQGRTPWLAILEAHHHNLSDALA
jgi:hypothetical protein